MSSTSKIKQQVVINYSGGDECRIAILENGRLEEFYSERSSEELHVGNIYLGTVMNIEPAIQAAFIDFGIGRNGFLHVSDLHPMYFPGSMREETESVGRKTPHRERPPIQQCLRKGQRVIVQVLKEGIGTKGPTLTTYPSLPGRYLVLLPYMAQHGVSRKIEDIDTRRKARDIVSSLDLPDDFGVILRTAGLDQTKTELKRDLAYLMRLWKDIEKKRKQVKRPTELYAESDLLLRTIRDVISPDVDRIWIDNIEALRRAQEYLRIVSPRQRTTELLLHHRATPIFHDFGIEEQIGLMHAREVPLVGGGSLIIDSAEAMVAIDVNSGRARRYSDAETTAYQVNLEAVDEIARQLRLRDLGGLIVLDLIDMRDSRHQRAVENRFRENLKRDRAKTEFQRISRFGILEMTRQRMRPSLRKTHYIDCPHCEGRGHIKSSESLVADALRNLAYLIDHPKVKKAEVVVSPMIAGTILSRRRQELAHLEHRIGKPIEVRISRSIAEDRIDYYAYDEANIDLDLHQLRNEFRNPASADADPIPEDAPERLEIAEREFLDEGAAADESTFEADLATSEGGSEAVAPKSKSRSRRGRRQRSRKSKDAKDQKPTDDSASPKAEKDAGKVKSSESERPGKSESGKRSAGDGTDDDAGAATTTRKKSKRRRRKKTTAKPASSEKTEATVQQEEPAARTSSDSQKPASADDSAVPPATRKKRRKRRSSKKTGKQPTSDSKADEPVPSDSKKTDAKKTDRETASATGNSQPSKAVSEPDEAPAPRTRRRLYKSRRRLSPAELVRAEQSDE